MPKIIESDDDADYTDSTNGGGGGRADAGDYVPPQQPAVVTPAVAPSGQPLGAHGAAATGPTAVRQPKKRILDEDDDFDPTGSAGGATSSYSGSHPSTSATASAHAAHPSAPRQTMAEDDFVLSDDELMEPPASKRPKFKFTSASSTQASSAAPSKATGAKSASAKAGQHFYSDDEGDSDFGDEDNVLSASDDEGDFMDFDDSEEYQGASQAPQRSKRTALQRAPSVRAPPLTPTKGPPAPVAPVVLSDPNDPNSLPVKRKRGRPPGSKTKNKVAIAPTKKTPTKRRNDDATEFSDEEEDSEVLVESDEYSEGEDGQRRSAGDDGGPKKLTARQKALSGDAGENSELMELSGTRNQATSLTPAAQRATLGHKAALYTKKVERTQPPPDVMAEVSVVVAQLLNRNPSYDKDDFRKRVVPEMYFNPELRKDWSRPNGNFITLPLYDHATSLPASLGWSSVPLKPEETADIPVVTLKRSIRDPA